MKSTKTLLSLTAIVVLREVVHGVRPSRDWELSLDQEESSEQHERAEAELQEELLDAIFGNLTSDESRGLFGSDILEFDLAFSQKALTHLYRTELPLIVEKKGKLRKDGGSLEEFSVGEKGQVIIKEVKGKMKGYTYLEVILTELTIKLASGWAPPLVGASLYLTFFDPEMNGMKAGARGCRGMCLNGVHFETSLGGTWSNSATMTGAMASGALAVGTKLAGYLDITRSHWWLVWYFANEMLPISTLSLLCMHSLRTSLFLDRYVLQDKGTEQYLGLSFGIILHGNKQYDTYDLDSLQDSLKTDNLETLLKHMQDKEAEKQDSKPYGMYIPKLTSLAFHYAKMKMAKNPPPASDSASQVLQDLQEAAQGIDDVENTAKGIDVDFPDYQNVEVSLSGGVADVLLEGQAKTQKGGVFGGLVKKLDGEEQADETGSAQLLEQTVSSDDDLEKQTSKSFFNFKTFKEQVTGKVDNIAAKTKDIAGEVGKKLVEVKDKVGNKAGQVAQNVGNAAGNIAQNIGKAYEGSVVSKVVNGVATPVKWVGSGIGYVGRGVAWVAGEAGQKVNELVVRIINAKLAKIGLHDVDWTYWHEGCLILDAGNKGTPLASTLTQRTQAAAQQAAIQADATGKALMYQAEHEEAAKKAPEPTEGEEIPGEASRPAPTPVAAEPYDASKDWGVSECTEVHQCSTLR